MTRYEKGTWQQSATPGVKRRSTRSWVGPASTAVPLRLIDGELYYRTSDLKSPKKESDSDELDRFIAQQNLRSAESKNGKNRHGKDALAVLVLSLAIAGAITTENYDQSHTETQCVQVDQFGLESAEGKDEVAEALGVSSDSYPVQNAAAYIRNNNITNHNQQAVYNICVSRGPLYGLNGYSVSRVDNSKQASLPENKD